ncbi:cytochrome P450 94A1-like [Cucumis melo var. makuwa]|uniref:Cytochrome P450 94A1-like n=2 Tax=Cucumis melo TaxID=3656 RepID=A0A1S3B728_CUCME|nr:cytochrome P450 94A1-like [Cucumis melo]KAA0053903.1 cytochrome P450 94A1-like [Cucumis melo var. makuwa]TYK25502.1 cytochrome P450 94A1-like [Cucumis melo var. makuwa]
MDISVLSLTPFIFLTFFSFSIYFLFFTSTKSKSKPQQGFKHFPFVGTLPLFLLNRHRFLDWSTEVLRNCRTNTAVFKRPGKVHGVITANPLVVEHILKTQFENYPKGERFISLLEDFLGRGIFNSDGEIWKVQRKTASYEFNTKSLRNFVMENVRVEIQSRLLPIFGKACETERILDLQDVLERFAFDNVCKLAFNYDPACLGGDGTAATEFMRAFEHAATLSSGRFMYAFPGSYKVKKFFNIGSEKTLKESIAVVHKFAEDIIHSRLEEKKTTQIENDQDLLSRFMGDQNNSPQFLRDIIISFILAGRDTTSSALTWFFWILSSRPDVEQKILAELETIRTKAHKEIGEMYSFDELRDMHYLQAALSETLRLYPPVPVDTKACRNDDVLPDGTFIGKSWFVTYHTYAMGRMESIWGKDYGEFSPERWLENGVCKTESPFRFPIFHAGPRMCLGKDMAYIQMKSIAAAVIEKFEVEMVEKKKSPKHLLSLTLRMENGLQVMIKRRDRGLSI